MNVIAAPSTGRLQPFRNLLVDFRVAISFVLFSSLIAYDLVMGWKPRAMLNAGDWHGLLGLMLVCSGLAVRSWAAGVLKKGKDLAVAGPYSLCRHPLYLGSFLMMLGFCHIIGEPSNYVLVVVSIAAIYWATMKNEERRIGDRYGSRWDEHAAKTPRLIPLRWSQFVAARWSAEQWLRNHEYRAVFSSVTGLAAIEIWRRWI